MPIGFWLGKVKVVSAWPTLSLSYNSVVTGFIQAYNQLSFTEMEPSASLSRFFLWQCGQALSALDRRDEMSTDVLFCTHCILSSVSFHIRTWFKEIKEKLYGADMVEGRDGIQRNLGRLQRWVCTNLMKFSEAKCTWGRAILSQKLLQHRVQLQYELPASL